MTAYAENHVLINQVRGATHVVSEDFYGASSPTEVFSAILWASSADGSPTRGFQRYS